MTGKKRKEKCRICSGGVTVQLSDDYAAAHACFSAVNPAFFTRILSFSNDHIQRLFFIVQAGTVADERPYIGVSDFYMFRMAAIDCHILRFLQRCH